MNNEMQSIKNKYIDVEHVIKKKAPSLGKKMPSFLFRLLKRIIHQDDLNHVLISNEGKIGLEFADAVIKDLSGGIEIRGLDKIPLDGKYIFASNHPLGGLDGIALLSALGSRFGNNVRFVVNDLLMHVQPLAPLFIPINKHGSQSKDHLNTLTEALESNIQLAIFPAGLVSRLHESGRVEDLDWKKTFVAQAIKYKRDIVPVYFEAENSKFFYKFAYWRKKMNVKLNIDMLFLPRELFNKRNQKFIIHIGDPISYKDLESERSHKQWADEIKKRIYAKHYRSRR
ncbi:MAG: 1-acyl-sn-glycerol-3-phosphate acyltransferase [Bacteroidales bacterium]